MPALKSLNPAWPHFAGIATLGLACLIGLGHWVLSGALLCSSEIVAQLTPHFFNIGWADPTHCQALLNEGSWLDWNHRNWQPDGTLSLSLLSDSLVAKLSNRLHTSFISRERGLQVLTIQGNHLHW